MNMYVAARALAANMLRVIAGAGTPDGLPVQAMELVQAFEPVRIDGRGQGLASTLRCSARATRRDEELENRVVTAALRVAAARLAEQPDHEKAARARLREAIKALDRVPDPMLSKSDQARIERGREELRRRIRRQQEGKPALGDD
jgi:hypothetical protein